MNHCRLLVVLGLALAGHAEAKLLKVTRDTGVYEVQGKRAVLIGKINANSAVNGHRTRGRGKFVEIDYKGKTALIKTEATNLEATRKVASIPIPDDSSSETVSSGPSAYMLNAGASFQYGTSMSAGLGVHFGIVPKSLVSQSGQLEAQLGFAFFPSAGSVTSGTTTVSSSGMTLAAYGRWGFPIAPKVHVGPELGLGLVQASASASVSGFGTVSGSASSIALSLGAYADGMFAHDWGWFGGLRFYTAGGVVLLAGAQYLF